MDKKNVFYYDTAIGKLGIVEKDQKIVQILFPNSRTVVSAQTKETPVIKQAFSELSEYFSGQRKIFSVPIQPEGTPFQQKVWQTLQSIPYGEVRSYQEVAKTVGNFKASRAVGMANNHNPLPFFIPCHRVVGADGSLTGYAGGVDVKQKLLQLEKK